MQENKNSRIFKTFFNVPVSEYAEVGVLKQLESSIKRVSRTAILVACGALASLNAQDMGEIPDTGYGDTTPIETQISRRGAGADSVPKGGAGLYALLARQKYPVSKVGVVLRDLNADSNMVGLNADSFFNPASVSKLLTATMAFDKLGPKFSFKTQVYMDGPFDPATGICQGNLYIRGGGDPSLFAERLWLFTQHLSCVGIKTVAKDIILDDSYFDSTMIGPGFYEESSDNPYMAPVNALSANFNCVSIWAKPGANVGDPIYADMLPKAADINFSSIAKTVATGSSPRFSIIARNMQKSTSITVAGSLSKDAPLKVEYCKVWQPRDYFAQVLKVLCNSSAITVKGAIRNATVPDSLRKKQPFYVFPSMPLSDIITDMMKYSSNFTAEMIFKSLSAQRDSGNGSWSASAQMALEWWKSQGLVGSPRILNGSGMGNSNRYSCRQIADLLSYVYTRKSFYPEFLYALPNAGVDGTLKSRFKHSRFRGILRGKTGTLNDFGVSAIAGYILQGKKTYAFAVIINNCQNKKPFQHWELQERILDLIVPK